MIDKQRVDRCRAKLIEIARAQKTITYSDLAQLLEVANQSIGLYLNAIYKEEIAKGRPDLTVVAVFQKTGMGRYNSKGGPAQSVVVDPNNSSDVKSYRDELRRVYKQWSRS
jgi:hypothetical protein